MAEEPNLPYYLSIAVGRIIGFIPFPLVLELCEIQSVSFRVWTHVVVSNTYNDKHTHTHTHTHTYIYMYMINALDIISKNGMK